MNLPFPIRRFNLFLLVLVFAGCGPENGAPGGGGPGNEGPGEDPADAVISLFTAEPGFIPFEGATTLSWQAENATACAIDGGLDIAGATSGTVQAGPATTTTYTLTCNGEGDSATAETIVKVAPQGVIFVAAGAGGAADGTTWADALTTVQEAADIALAGQKVWVAEGSYFPAAANGPVLTMAAGVEVYGGFAGTETALAERPAPLLLSLLSGDFGHDDPGTLTDNSTHVVVAASEVVLDGFTISGGNAAGAGADGQGGGLFGHTLDQILLSHLVFAGNTAASNGGAAFLNTVDHLAVTDSTFSGNYSEVSSGGLSIYNTNALTAQPTLSNLTFSANSAFTRAGGMLLSTASPTLQKVVFVGNTNTDESGSTGGGAVWMIHSDPVFRNVLFLDNTTTGGSGAMFLDDSKPVLANVTFRGNTAEQGGGGAIGAQNLSSFTATNVTFDDNWAGWVGGVLYLIGSHPHLTNVTFTNNHGTTEAGGIYNQDADPVITNSVFWGNTTTNGNAKDMYNLNYVESSDPVPSYLCAEQNLGGTGFVQVSASPLVTAASGELFLNQAGTDCVDNGSEAAANDGTYGYLAVGLQAWSAMTTDIGGALDSDDGTENAELDRGRHHDPAHVWIATFADNGGFLQWGTHQATGCELDDGAGAVTVPAAVVDDSFPSSGGTTYSLTCGGEPFPATATVEAP